MIEITNMKVNIFDYTAGICCRTLLPEITKSRLPENTQKRIYFPEFSWGSAPSRRKLSADDGELHVVHGGTFKTDPRGVNEFYGLLWLARRAEEFKIHFHLFVHKIDSKELELYKTIADNSSYFHLKTATSPEWIIEKIEVYDVGISTVLPRNQRDLEEIPIAHNPKGSWGAKFGDYLDAGIYSLINWKARSICFAFERYGCGESLTPEKVLSKDFWQDLKHRVLIEGIDLSLAREKFNIERHGGRLVKFYTSICEAKAENHK